MSKHGKKKKNYWFLLLLLLTCIIVVPCVVIYDVFLNADTEPMEEEPTTTVATTTTEPTTLSTTTATTTTESVATSATVPTQTVSTASTATGKTTAGTTSAPATSASMPDTLFIGDSRTDGLSLYGKIDGATFFAKTSLNAFKILGNAIEVKGYGTLTLEQLLEKKQFKTVYIMLGINEIGYNINTVVGKYQTLLDAVKSRQKDAKIVIQSTFYVTKAAQSEKRGITNPRIRELNTKLAALADNTRVFFIDLNPLYDDGDGNLGSQYTKDGIHFYSKYYPMWRDYLIAHPV